MFGTSDGPDDALMDSFYGLVESPVLVKIRRTNSKAACCVTEQMPKSLLCVTLAFLVLLPGLNSAHGKVYEHSLLNNTITPVHAGSSNSTRPSGSACLPSGSCSSRRLLQEDALYRHIHPAIVTHRRPRHKRPINYKLTGRIPRKDPLDSFRVYDGGFNVTDKHYWSSVTYTGIWGYVLACLCLVFCAIYGFLYCCGCCDRSYREGVSRMRLVFVYIFSCIAIIAAAIIYWGNARLGQQLRSTAGTLLTATDGIQSEINNALGLVQVASMFPISRQGSSQQFLQACVNLGNTFNNLQRKVEKNKDRVYRIFDNVKVALTVVSAVLAVVVIIGLVGAMGSWRYLLLTTFCLMTLLLFASWIMAGISYALTNVANDACQIMNEYDENPQNSSISKYLPCLSNTDANKALAGAKEAIKSLVTQANVAIDWVNREEKRLASKRSLPVEFVLPRVCDPYGPPPSYTDSLCLSGEVSFGDFEKVYGPYRCENDNLTHCFEVDTPIPNFAYEEADMAMNASNIVYRMLPTIFRIITCNFVKVTFEDILFHNCRPLRKSLTTLWAGFIVASVAMMILQILWALFMRNIGRDRQGFITRRYMSPDNLVRRIDIPHISGRGICGGRGGTFGGGRNIVGGTLYLVRRAFGGIGRVRAPMFYPVLPRGTPTGSRAATPVIPPPPMGEPSGTPTTDFSIYGDALGGPMRWLKRAMSRTPVPHPALSLPGSRAATPGRAALASRAGTPAAVALGPRIGTPAPDVAMPKSQIPFGAAGSTRNQGFG